jgi:hypothetical protein
MVMGPKAIRNEYVDGVLQPSESEPLVYDGVVLNSPAVDYNYDTSEYVFSEAGQHTISWRPEGLESNTLVVTVVE